MSEKKICSRREADVLIEKGWVFVNDKPITELGTKVSPEAKIELHPLAQEFLSQKATVLLNKPLGYVSTPSSENYPLAESLIIKDNQSSSCKEDSSPLKNKTLSVAGRLDINSTGLMVLTENGKLADEIISQKTEMEKEYIVTVKGDIQKSKIEKLCYGLSLDGEKLKRAAVSSLNPQQLRFILKQGKKRQIRRMCEQVELQVTSIHRIRIGNIHIGDLKKGFWRYLKKNEKF